MKFAAGPVLVPALALAVLLVAFAHGYGYHRDELYFLVAGRHLAWAYADQGPVTPLIAHATDTIAPGSLTVLRLPSALMSGLDVIVTALIAFEFGASRRAQLIAASCTAVAAVVSFVGHLLSTTTFDLLAWATVTWLVARILRTGREHLWVLAGLVSGVALLNKPLLAFFLAALGCGLVLVGPRQPLRSPWLWAGLALAAAIWSPWLIWQAQHSWPQLEVSSSIASGGSSSSQPRWALLPFQFLLVSPVLAPVWVTGLIALARSDRFRRFRAFAVAWVFLAIVFLATGGKPYYLAGTFPVLLAAGATEVDAWLDGGGRARAVLLWSMVALSGAVSALLALPLLPARDAGPAVSVNSDVGETIGWPELTGQVAAIYKRTGRPAVIFTSNYGEAGAIDRFGPRLGLPHAYSGHNAFGTWGPPTVAPGPVIAIGIGQHSLRQFRECRVAALIGNAAQIHNSEHGRKIYLCRSPAAPWSEIWPRLTHLG